MTRWILIAILALVITALVYIYFVKPSVDREDEVVNDASDVASDDVGDEVNEEVVDCSGLVMSTRKNCLIAEGELPVNL